MEALETAQEWKFTSNYFFGQDTYGRHYRLARREDGQWFFSSWAYNGYGMGWTKWEASYEDYESGVFVDDEGKERMKNGFKSNIELYGIVNKRIRLPKN